MRKKLLIVVDYQNDFVTGSLGFDAAVDIHDAVVAKIREYRSLGDKGQIIFTMDTHGKNYMETEEGRNLPVAHCIENTDGWNLYGEVYGLKEEGDLVFSKPTFGSIELGEYLKERCDDYEQVELIGVVTNICVISNVVMVKAAMHEVPIVVDSSCVASNDKAVGDAALEVMKTLHVRII